MNITERNVLDTGGNIQVVELVIEGGGELKTIGISSDCVVGYNCAFIDNEGEDNVLWAAYQISSLPVYLDRKLVQPVINEFLVMICT